MKKTAAVLFIIGFFMITSCIMKRHKNGDRPCTEEYRMLTISIKDNFSKPVILDDYFVKKTSTGEIIDFAKEDPYFDSINRMQGIYLICTDGKMSMTSRQGTEFVFHGFLDSAEIVKEPYIIGNDECHVIMLYGKPEIIIPE